MNAHEHTETDLMRLFPESEFRQATQTLVAIKQITEDKQMYDATEKARRDRQWAINATRAEGELKGELKGKIELIHTLEGLLGQVPSEESKLKSTTLEELQKMVTELQSQLRSRMA
jgi:hypothetical protein